MIHRDGCKTVGIDASLQIYVYPIMALIHEKSSDAQIDYIGIENASSVFATQQKAPRPCAVACLGCMRVQAKWSEYRWLGNRATLVDDDNVVFWPGGSQLQRGRTAYGRSCSLRLQNRKRN